MDEWQDTERLAGRKVWRPRVTGNIKRLMRGVATIECAWCRLQVPGAPTRLPEGWVLLEDGVIVCDECLEEDRTGVRKPTRIY